jgi:hypothetical protein
VATPSWGTSNRISTVVEQDDDVGGDVRGCPRHQNGLFLAHPACCEAMQVLGLQLGAVDRACMGLGAWYVWLLTPRTLSFLELYSPGVPDVGLL